MNDRDLADFGTAKYPLRSSGLASVVSCPWKAVYMYLGLNDPDTSGPAADTGSAVHAACADFHKRKEVATAIQVMRSRLSEYPLADLDEAAKMFLCYSQDPRNQTAEVVAVEQKIEIILAEAGQKEIVIHGTLDQLRIESGVWSVWDIKTSKRPAYSLLNEHLLQVAAYAYGAHLRYNQPVNLGGLILPRAYLTKGVMAAHAPPQAYIKYQQTFKDIPLVLASLINTVQNIRNGNIWFASGSQCDYCPAQGPQNCIPKLTELLDNG